MRAYLWKERGGYSVWLHSEHTNSKVECIGLFSRKREALAVLRKHNKIVDARYLASLVGKHA